MRPSQSSSLTGRQRDALVWLRNRPDASRTLACEQRFADRTIEALVAAGLAEYVWVGRDGPIKVVRITDAGALLLSREGRSE